LAELGSYRALRNGPLTHPTTIVSFQARSAASHHPVDPRDFMDPFVPPSVTGSDMPVNFIQIVTNRNNWYLDAEAIDLARRVRQAVGGGRIVTYGSSMGGFAAVNLAGVLEAA